MDPYTHIYLTYYILSHNLSSKLDVPFKLESAAPRSMSEFQRFVEVPRFFEVLSLLREQEKEGTLPDLPFFVLFTLT